MKKFNVKLSKLLDYQKFENNKKLDEVLNSCSIKEELTSSQLLMAAGGTKKSQRHLHKQEYKKNKK